MKRSSDRVLTTHTGSLPRPDDLAAILIARADGVDVAEAALNEHIESATTEIVARQVELGIDVVSDGEMSKIEYVDYTRQRLTGFEDLPETDSVPFRFADLDEFPDIVEAIYGGWHVRDPQCTGPIQYVGHDLVAADIERFQAALGRTSATEAFISAASPGIIAMSFCNAYYKTYEEYVFALAEAMRAEYRAITDAGLLVQTDAPDLGMCGDMHTWMRSEVERRGVAGLQELHVEALNIALQGIPADRVRMHLCWGNYMGPHTHDLCLADVLKPAMRANVGAINFESANPRHAHEWELFAELQLPDGLIIIPGVIDTKTQVVEHPGLVAQRISRYADLVGQENLIAGTDCGFGTAVGGFTVHHKVAWLKLQALGEGARLASGNRGIVSTRA